jgi:predicted ribosomally synthesized peptide with nif11-like leader
MSASEVIRLTTDMKTNSDLLNVVKESSGSLSKVVQVAAQHGYSFTVQEANEYLSSNTGAELEDAQLDAVAGGKGHSPPKATIVSVAVAVTVAVAAAEAAVAVEVAGVVAVVVV